MTSQSYIIEEYGAWNDSVRATCPAGEITNRLTSRSGRPLEL